MCHQCCSLKCLKQNHGKDLDVIDNLPIDFPFFSALRIMQVYELIAKMCIYDRHGLHSKVFEAYVVLDDLLERLRPDLKKYNVRLPVTEGTEL